MVACENNILCMCHIFKSVIRAYKNRESRERVQRETNFETKYKVKLLLYYLYPVVKFIFLQFYFILF